MEHEAAGLLVALERSAWGDFVRGSPLLYPLANTLHVVAVLVFFAVVAAMDLRLLGWLRGEPVTAVIARLRPVAITALLVVAATGFTLFTPEASAIIRNPAFQLKLAAIALALANVAVLERRFGDLIRGNTAAVPPGARFAALASLTLWLLAAACGRFIAYL